MCGNTCGGFVGNILWLLICGWVLFLFYLFFGLVLCITIVGIPFGIQIFKLAVLALWPFGKTVVRKESAGSCCSVAMNVFWFIFGGIEIAFVHVIFGILFGITICGIPCAKQHFKLAGLAIYPFGHEVVSEGDEHEHVHHHHHHHGYQAV